MKNIYFFVCSILIIAISSCSTTPPEPGLVLKTEKVLDYNYSSLELEVLKLVNDYRISQKLKPLSIINHISYVASEHNKLMIANKTLSHQFFDVRKNNIITVLGASLVGENLGFNFSTAAVIVNAWIASPEHNAIMLSDFTHFGISIQISPEENKNYCTNIFAKIN